MARRQIALPPSSIFVLPFALEARDHSRGKVGRVLAEQGGEGLLEIAGGNPAQIENSQQGVEALGAPRPFALIFAPSSATCLSFASPAFSASFNTCKNSLPSGGNRHRAAGPSSCADRMAADQARSVACDDLRQIQVLARQGTSRLFEAGFSIEQVSLVTGHKDWKMLCRYTHLKPEALHNARVREAA